MSMYKYLLLASFFSINAFAQTDLGSWLIYKNKLSLNNNTSIDTQYQHRSFNLDLAEDQALITAGLSHAVMPNVSIAAGYRKIAVLNENGAYQKLAFTSKLNKVSLTNAFMLEERWLGDNFQLRYRFGLTAKFPLTEKAFVSLSEEVFLQNSGSSFNQNRITAQVSHKISDALQINSGIMHWQFPTLKRWVFLLSLSHALSL